jgi:hypothetical protein
MASLAERTARPWTATSRRDRPAGCSTGASSLCGAVCGNGRSPEPTSMVCRAPIGWAARIRRRAGEDDLQAPRRDQHDLAATQRHPCRSGMVTTDWARSRSRPETVVASGGTEGSAENSLRSQYCSPLARARGADDGGSKCGGNSMAQWICHRPDVPRSHRRNERAQTSPFSSTGNTRRRLP